MFGAIFNFSRGGWIKTVGFLLAAILIGAGTFFVNGKLEMLPEASVIREANYQRAARNTDWYTFSEQSNKRYDSGEVARIEADLQDFLYLGESWRAKGSYQLETGPLTQTKDLYVDLDISYNADLDFYKFYLNGWCMDDANLKAYLGIEDSEGFLNFDRTIYLVNEDNKIWMLWESDGNKIAVEVKAGNMFYAFLMSLCPQEAINTSYMDDAHMIASHSRGVDSFRYEEAEIGNTFGYSTGFGASSGIGLEKARGFRAGYDLRLFDGKPIGYGLGTETTLNGEEAYAYYNFDYFYDKIPDDKPTVADWK
jgi:hypothetical protein